MPMTPNHRELERLTAQRDVPEGFSLAAIRARNGVTDTPPPRLIQPRKTRRQRKPAAPRRQPRPVDPIRAARSSQRYQELLEIFTPEQTIALTLAGYALRPGGHTTSAAGVAGSSHLPAKDGHDPLPRRAAPAPAALLGGDVA